MCIINELFPFLLVETWTVSSPVWALGLFKPSTFCCFYPQLLSHGSERQSLIVVFSHRDQNSTWLWGTSALPPPPVLSAALPNLAILASLNMITPRLIKTAVFFVPASLFYGVETASWQYVQADVGFASLVLLFSGIKFCAACCPGSENNWLIYSVSFLAVTPSWLESMINVFSVPKSATILTV